MLKLYYIICRGFFPEVIKMHLLLLLEQIVQQIIGMEFGTVKEMKVFDIMCGMQNTLS